MPILSHANGALLRNGEPHTILAGAIHYFRVHPEQWRDRLERLKAMGANTVDTYVAWNFHQLRAQDVPDFTGWRDLAGFITLAGELGLDVIVRPGPYICAEWDNGGFPSWLTGTPGIGLRTADPVFTDAVGTWFDQLLPVIEPLQAAKGGPVVAVQVENEYGSYGDSAEYIRWNAQALRSRGITETLFTADGGTDYFLDGGSVPEIWATATLGSRGAEAINTWNRRRPGEPFFNVEFWGGWFDHWGESHHVRDPQDSTAAMEEMLDAGGSVCVYMAHGGSNFGLWAGANEEGRLQPTVTSYDSDAPIAEDGSLTPKFHLMRQAFLKASGLPREQWPAIPGHLLAAPAVLPAAELPLTQPTSPLLHWLRSRRDSAHDAGETLTSERPLSFEELQLHSGLVLYSGSAVLPGLPDAPQQSTLRLPQLRDRAHVWVDGDLAGVLDDLSAEEGLKLQGTGQRVRLEILVENLGRINYGPRTGESKGLLGGVLVDRRYTFGWEHTRIDLTGRDLGSSGLVSPDQASPDQQDLAGFGTATLDVSEPADAHLEVVGGVKGFLWVNGFLLGRYWEIGPQKTLYVPGPLLKVGTNIISVLDLDGAPTAVRAHERPDLGAVTGGPIAAAELP